VDRLEPLLLNSRTEGHTWKKFNIKSDRVFQKNEHVKEVQQNCGVISIV
jgi:putative hydrolase of HD superfamily